MSDAENLLRSLRARGIEVVSDGSTLRYRPINYINNHDLTLLRKHRLEVIRVLQDPVFNSKTKAKSSGNRRNKGVLAFGHPKSAEFHDDNNGKPIGRTGPTTVDAGSAIASQDDDQSDQDRLIQQMLERVNATFSINTTISDWTAIDDASRELDAARAEDDITRLRQAIEAYETAVVDASNHGLDEQPHGGSSPLGPGEALVLRPGSPAASYSWDDEGECEPKHPPLTWSENEQQLIDWYVECREAGTLPVPPFQLRPGCRVIDDTFYEALDRDIELSPGDIRRVGPMADLTDLRQACEPPPGVSRGSI